MSDLPIIPFLTEAEAPFETEVGGVPIIVAPAGWSVHEQSHLLFLPRRIRGLMRVSSLQSFIEYVNRFKEQNTIIMLTQGKGSLIVVEAIIDYHGATSEVIDKGNRAAWCDHTAVLQSVNTSAWAAWSEGNNQFMRQSDFAEFIYENKADILEPNGADLLEIVETLRVHSKGEYRDMAHKNGSYEIINSIKTSITAGPTQQTMAMPDKFTIALQTFHGGPLVRLQADIYMKILKSEEPLMMKFKFHRLGDVMEHMNDEIGAELANKCGVPVYRRAG